MKSSIKVNKSTAGSGKKGNLANLRPFPKGVSGNPEGHNQFTDGKAEVNRRALDAAQKAIGVLIAQLSSIDERIAQNAAKEILDRALGRPVQAIANTDSTGADRPPPPPMIVVAVEAKPRIG